MGGAGRGGVRVRQRTRAAGRHPSLRPADVRDDALLGNRADVANQPPVGLDFARIWQAADKIVYSTTLQTPDTARTRIERDFDPVQVRKLKEAADRDLTVGGARLAAQAIAAGLVDEYQLFVVPAVVGGGTRALPDQVRLNLALAEEHRFGSGTVYLCYRPA